MARLLPVLLLLLLGASCGGESAGSRGLPLALPERREVPEAPWARLTAAQVDEARFLGVPAAFENARGLRFVYIPRGQFRMGSPQEEAGRGTDEEAHDVRLYMGYYLQVAPVIPQQRGAAGEEAGALLPGFSHAEAVAFAAELSAEDPDRDYRLPTEAEWEHACRAGTTGAYWWGSEARPVGERENPWGLRGMSTGPLEWCRDRYAPLPSWTVGDPMGPQTGEGEERGHVLRGGGSLSQPSRSARRGSSAAAGGVREVALRLVSPVGYGLRQGGSVSVTFGLTDPLTGEVLTHPDEQHDLRIIRMNDRLASRTAGTETIWARVVRPAFPLTLTMVPGKYYVYAETQRAGALARGREIKFHVWDHAVDVPVPAPERDLKRYGSGGAEKPQ